MKVRRTVPPDGEEEDEEDDELVHSERNIQPLVPQQSSSRPRYSNIDYTRPAPIFVPMSLHQEEAGHPRRQLLQRGPLTPYQCD
ncbi:hypothetical protein AZE42_11199 [Rhizopogon vesiculosus]|uniref:Uncharacterized protein n=1 Tax=Rhizopogon vesiculosus TaxID=180088 RepID=A0A1J8QFS2_9AGAM|nr:hypothetical protein AZE42_11199 [Rhizopogon vesiculosus]